MRRRMTGGNGRYARAKMMGKKAAAENGEISFEHREPCKKGHREFLEDFSQIKSSMRIFEGWSYRFRCLDCNQARSELRYFNGQNF